MNNERESRPEGASPRGYHFIDAYRSCKRAWAFRYVLGLEPDVPKAPLAMGKAIHAWQEEYFVRMFIGARNIEQILKDEDMSMHKILTDEIPKETFFDPDEWVKALKSAWEVCEAWARTTYDDFNSYRPLLVEEELTYPLEVMTRGGMVVVQITGRVDRLFENSRSASLLLIDTKSTANKKVDYVQKTNEAQDQFVMYSALVQKKFGQIPIVVLDVCGYAPVRYERSEEFFFSADEIEDFLEGLAGSWSDLIQSLEIWEEEKLLRTKATQIESVFHELFPRCTGRCAYFGCEYSDFCRGARDLFEPRLGFRQYKEITMAEILEGKKEDSK